MYFYAIAMLPLATAVTLNYTSPIFLALYFAAFAGMRLRGGMIVALVIGFVGVIVLLRPTCKRSNCSVGSSALGSGIVSGFAYFNVRELGARGEPKRGPCSTSLFATLCSAAWMLLYEFHPVDLHGGLLLIGVGAFATLAQLCMTRLQARQADRRGQLGLHRNRLRQPVRHGDLGRGVLGLGLGASA